MAHPGMKRGEDYVVLPYNPEWQPVASRAWAMQYLRADGSEDMPGFIEEFRGRHPYLWNNQVPAYIPESVDHYLRTDHNGERQDIDVELASIPLTDEEKAEAEALKTARNRDLRLAALRARGREVPAVLAAAETSAPIEPAPPKRGPGRPPKSLAASEAPDLLDP